MTTQISHACSRCGRPAALEHHHPARGMGGQGPKAEEHPRVPLCRTCHDSVHRGDFRLEVSEGIVETFAGSSAIVESHRGIQVDDEGDDPSFHSDERLAHDWHYAEMNALDALEMQARAAFEFWRRYGYADRWYETVADIIGKETGRRPHSRRVYERVALYKAFEGRWDHYSELGSRISIAVAESDEPETAMSFALTQKSDAALTSTEIADVIRKTRVGDGYEPPPTHPCPDCGAVHKIKTQA